MEENLTLCEENSEKAAMQRLELLLSTKKGTVPCYRDFGLKGDFLDRPFEAAKALMSAELMDAVERFIPELELTELSFELEDGKIKCKPKVRLKA